MKRNLQLELLDRHLMQINPLAKQDNISWIKTLRQAIGMSGKQLATRVGISQQALSKIELNEKECTTSLKTLNRIANAMSCDLCYCIKPKQGNVKDLLAKQAYKKAKQLVLATHHTMKLEAQATNNIEDKIQNLANKLMENPKASLWED